MQRHTFPARPDWKARLESQGLIWHTHEDGSAYWQETAAYGFSHDEIESLETATAELQRLCLEAVAHVIETRSYARYGLLPQVGRLIEESWERDEVSLYGRFDLAYTGEGPPKLLEYNADTPTSLVEASVIQWHWLQDRFPEADQWNSLHERLVEAWKRAEGYLPLAPVHFLHMDCDEDLLTVAYLEDCAKQAGVRTRRLLIDDLGWDEARQEFLDLEGDSVRAAFKLYPWEFMLNDVFAQHLARDPRPCTFLEPAWKMLLSNKALLAVLWELFPDCPYLLPTFQDGPRHLQAYVTKPLLSREGANVTLHQPGMPTQASPYNPAYGAEGHVTQALAPLKRFDGYTPILGTWIVDGEPAGMGIRESLGPVTDNRSAFVPHWIL